MAAPSPPPRRSSSCCPRKYSSEIAGGSKRPCAPAGCPWSSSSTTSISRFSRRSGEQTDSPHELGFLDRRENVIFLGSPGVGKTHLAISLAIAAAESGRRVYYGTLADLITSLEEAQTAGRCRRA